MSVYAFDMDLDSIQLKYVLSTYLVENYTKYFNV